MSDEPAEPQELVKQVISSENSYIINGLTLFNEIRAQFEYNEIKSPAIAELELLSKGQILVPRWLVS